MFLQIISIDFKINKLKDYKSHPLFNKLLILRLMIIRIIEVHLYKF